MRKERSHFRLGGGAFDLSILQISKSSLFEAKKHIWTPKTLTAWQRERDFEIVGFFFSYLFSFALTTQDTHTHQDYKGRKGFMYHT